MSIESSLPSSTQSDPTAEILTTPVRSRSRLFVSMLTTLACVVAFGFGILAGCVESIPVDEYTMARAAYEAAKAADSARFAPNIWFSAEEAYRAGEKSFKDRRYSDATLFFHRAQELSEQAENIAQLTSKQSGEVIP